MKVKYRIFVSSEEFEAWQEKEKVQIFAVQPMVSGMQFNVEDGSAGTNITVFVTYTEATFKD